MIAHIMDGMLIGAAITCMAMQQYKSALIFGVFGILTTVLDVITVVEDYNKEIK
jgi:hypothetical protein